VTQEELDTLKNGITIEGIRYGSIDAKLERGGGANSWITVSITEGKNREVRRVLEFLGLQISRLIRTAYGPFELANLPRGAVAEIRQVDVERFRKDLTAADFTPRTIAVNAEAPSRRAAPAGDEKGRGRDRARSSDAAKPAPGRPQRSSFARDDKARPATGRPQRPQSRSDETRRDEPRPNDARRDEGAIAVGQPDQLGVL
jgi:23S rRNA pseudouridine2605 synthase